MAAVILEVMVLKCTEVLEKPCVVLVISQLSSHNS